MGGWVAWWSPWVGVWVCVFLQLKPMICNNSDDTEMLWQMRMLYCRFNLLVRLLNKCSNNVLIEL